MTTATDNLVHTGGAGDDAEGPFALSHLDALEAESVHIFREVAGSSSAR